MWMSMNITQTFSFGTMHIFSMFTAFVSRMPRSTTRACSIAWGLGGPDSNDGLAIGMSSALVDRTPEFGVSGYGSPGANFNAPRTVRLSNHTPGAPLPGLHTF